MKIPSGCGVFSGSWSLSEKLIQVALEVCDML